MRVEFAPQADADLEDIGDFIARDNPARAVRFISEIKTTCVGLGRAPDVGTPRAELSTGIRMLTHGRYLIFYRKKGALIRIERVMHSARDISVDDFDAAN